MTAWLDVLIVLILLGFGISGYAKGLIKGVMSLFSLIIALIGAKIFLPVAINFLNAATTVKQTLAEFIRNNVLPIVTSSNGSESWLNSSSIFNISNSAKGDVSNFWISCENSPLGFQEAFVQNATNVVLEAITFVVLFLVIYALLTVLVEMLDIIASLPVLNFLNKTLGLAIGLIKGIICLVILITALNFIGIYTANSVIVQGLNASMLANYFYIGYLFSWFRLEDKYDRKL